jgi:hypothetical protein
LKEKRLGIAEEESADHLPAELATLEERRRKLQDVMQTLQLQDEARRKAGKNPEKNPAQRKKDSRSIAVSPCGVGVRETGLEPARYCYH